MTGSYYDACHDHVGRIERAYDALLEAIDGYIGMVSLLQGQVPPEKAPTLGLALKMQERGVQEMAGHLEDEVLDGLIRFADRVIRIKHAEEGTFV